MQPLPHQPKSFRNSTNLFDLLWRCCRLILRKALSLPSESCTALAPASSRSPPHLSRSVIPSVCFDVLISRSHAASPYTPHLHDSISGGESDDSELQVLQLPLDTLRYLARAHQLLCTGREASSCDGLQRRGRPSEGAVRYLRQGCAYAGQTHFFLIYVLLLRGSALFLSCVCRFSLMPALSRPATGHSAPPAPRL